MKYSLRSLMVNVILAVPFLLFGLFASYCVREALVEYEMLLFYRSVIPAGDPQPWARP